MIDLSRHPLDDERSSRIKKWLEMDECRWFQEALAASIALNQAKATNLMLEKPHIILTDSSMPKEAHNLMRNAALLQCLLDSMEIMLSPQSGASKVTLAAGFKPKPPPEQNERAESPEQPPV